MFLKLSEVFKESRHHDGHERDIYHYESTSSCCSFLKTCKMTTSICLVVISRTFLPSRESLVF